MKSCEIVALVCRKWPKLLLGLPALAIATALAASPSSSTIPTETFTPPREKHFRGRYPFEAAEEGREGWVKLAFMVSAKGKPYAVTVVDSSGGEIIANAAVRIIEHATFTPGTRNGKPVDSGFTGTLPFVITGSDRGVTLTFNSNYRRLRRSIKSQDKATATRLLKRFDPRNLTEDAYYALAKFDYAAAWGTGAEELEDLERATSDANYVRNTGDGSRVFPPAAIYSISLQILGLEINLGRYTSALSSWKWLEGHGLKKSDRMRLAPAIAQIQHIKAAHLSYSTTGIISATGWNIGLFEQQFSITRVTGLITQIDLYCQGGFVKFPFNPKLQYTVRSPYGSCNMKVLGEPGTRFTLTQF